jgi:hypothetical protein
VLEFVARIGSSSLGASSHVEEAQLMTRQHYNGEDHLIQAKIASQPLDVSQCLIKSPPLDQDSNERILGLGNWNA